MSELPTSQLACDLVKEMSGFLSENKLSEAFSAIHDNKYSACLKDNSWDLIPVITNYLDEKTHDESPELFECCEKLLEIVAEKSNAEEALLEFIEQAELAKQDVKFLAILNALQKTLLKLTSKRGRSLEWVFNTIQDHLSDIPLPGEYNLESEEKILLDADSAVRRITLLYKELLPFYKPFIDEVSLPNHDLHLKPERKQRRDLLACYMLQLLGKPLACLDLECDVKAKSRARICAERIMEYLSQLVGDCFKFLEYVTHRKPPAKTCGIDEEPIKDVFACPDRAPTLSLGVYYYLLLSEGIQVTQIPLVYDPLYVFQSVFHLVADLLKFSEQFITRKGLLLAHALICSDAIHLLPYQALDSTAHCNFCGHLTNILVYSDVKQYRELSLKILKSYIYKFDTKGRHLLISNLMDTVQHDGTRAVIIEEYKQIIYKAFKEDENKIPDVFCGQSLFKMVDTFCYLPEGSETDLMQHGDQILTVLNMLLFLLRRDLYNATGIWNHVPTLEKNFLKPLKQGIIISKAHYEAKIKEFENEHHGEGDAKFSVSVHGESIPDMSPKDKMQALVYAMNSFATLEMVLIRVEEIIDDRPST